MTRAGEGSEALHIIYNPGAPSAAPTTFAEFLRTDGRAGTIVTAAPVTRARNPSYAMTIDLGPVLGVRRSVARLTELFTPEDLIGRQGLAVVNLPPRQVADAMSEVLVLGLPDAAGAIVLVSADANVATGAACPDRDRLAPPANGGAFQRESP